MSICKRKPENIPPVSRYVIKVMYPEGGTFHLNLIGARDSDPLGHDPARLADGITEGLRREGFYVEVAEESTLVRWK